MVQKHPRNCHTEKRVVAKPKQSFSPLYIFLSFLNQKDPFIRPATYDAIRFYFGPFFSLPLRTMDPASIKRSFISIICTITIMLQPRIPDAHLFDRLKNDGPQALSERENDARLFPFTFSLLAVFPHPLGRLYDVLQSQSHNGDITPTGR